MAKLFFELAADSVEAEQVVRRALRSLLALGPNLRLDLEGGAQMREHRGDEVLYCRRLVGQRRPARARRRATRERRAKLLEVLEFNLALEDVQRKQQPVLPAEIALRDLHNLAVRSSSRHRWLFRVHMLMAAAVMGFTAAFVGWTGYLVHSHTLDYRVAFGAGGAGATGLFWKRFEPFDKVRDSLRTIERSDYAATLGRIRIAAISGIEDPKQRDAALAGALREMLELV